MSAAKFEPALLIRAAPHSPKAATGFHRSRPGSVDKSPAQPGFYARCRLTAGPCSRPLPLLWPRYACRPHAFPVRRCWSQLRT